MASKFEQRLKDIQTGVRTTAAELLSSGRALWFGVVDNKPVDGKNHSDIADAFDREQEATDYNSALNGEGSFKLAQAAKIRNDTLASIERDVRMRTRSRVRMMAHSAASLTTQGLADGPLGRAIMFEERLKEQSGG